MLRWGEGKTEGALCSVAEGDVLSETTWNSKENNEKSQTFYRKEILPEKKMNKIKLSIIVNVLLLIHGIVLSLAQAVKER